MPILKHYW